ncbi:hypothetical protein GN956_G16158 [Arapaima gigas]
MDNHQATDTILKEGSLEAEVNLKVLSEAETQGESSAASFDRGHHRVLLKWSICHPAMDPIVYPVFVTHFHYRHPLSRNIQNQRKSHNNWCQPSRKVAQLIRI